MHSAAFLRFFGLSLLTKRMLCGILYMYDVRSFIPAVLIFRGEA